MQRRAPVSRRSPERFVPLTQCAQALKDQGVKPRDLVKTGFAVDVPATLQKAKSRKDDELRRKKKARRKQSQRSRRGR